MLKRVNFFIKFFWIVQYFIFTLLLYFLKVNDESIEHMTTSEIIDLLRIVRGPVCIVVSRVKSNEDCQKSNAVNWATVVQLNILSASVNLVIKIIMCIFV